MYKKGDKVETPLGIAIYDDKGLYPNTHYVIYNDNLIRFASCQIKPIRQLKSEYEKDIKIKDSEMADKFFAYMLVVGKVIK